MKHCLHILFVCSILHWPLQIHAQQQTSLPALKAEAVAEVDKMQAMTQQMVDQCCEPHCSSPCGVIIQ